MTWIWAPVSALAAGVLVAVGVLVEMGPFEVAVGDGLGDVGVGDELGDVGVGDGLGDVGDGDGEAGAGGLGDEHGAGAGYTLLLGLLPGLADVAWPWVADARPGTAEPLPLGLPGPPPWLEVLVPGGLSFSSPMNVPRICPRAKTPATTRTTAPATARAGRNQVIAGPAEPRSEEPAVRGRLTDWAAMPRRMASDRSCPFSPAVPAPSAVLASPAASAPAAEPDRSVLNQD